MASSKAFIVTHISHLLCAAYEQTVYAFRTSNNFPFDQSGHFPGGRTAGSLKHLQIGPTKALSPIRSM